MQCTCFCRAIVIVFLLFEAILVFCKIPLIWMLVRSVDEQLLTEHIDDVSAGNEEHG